jgi:ketosteroid isomerase-like protein
MAEHPNVARIRSAYEAFASADVATLSERLAEDAVWHISGHHTFSGDYHGRDQILGFFGAITEDTGGTVTLEVHDILANDCHAVVLVQERAQRKGRSLDIKEVHVAHIDQHGQVTEFWEFQEDQISYDSFWS